MGGCMSLEAELVEEGRGIGNSKDDILQALINQFHHQIRVCIELGIAQANRSLYTRFDPAVKASMDYGEIFVAIYQNEEQPENIVIGGNISREQFLAAFGSTGWLQDYKFTPRGWYRGPAVLQPSLAYVREHPDTPTINLTLIESIPWVREGDTLAEHRRYHCITADEFAEKHAGLLEGTTLVYSARFPAKDLPLCVEQP